LYIVTSQQMQAAEKAADAAGLSYEQMMENAGRAIAEAITMEFELRQARVLILVGPGNNGGDGLVVARHLAQAGAGVTVYAWKRKLEGDKNWHLLDNLPVERFLEEEPAERARLRQALEQATIIVDALLGTGASRPIEGNLAELLGQVKAIVTARRAPQPGLLIEPSYPNLHWDRGPVVVAVDLPSGLNSNTGAVDPCTLPADLTLTLAAVKRGHILLPGANVIGRLIVADIRITADYYPNDVTLEMATANKVISMLPARTPASHKGTFGTALLVVGSKHYTGAAILAGRSAGRIGTGLVTVAPPEAIYPLVASNLAEATYWPLPHHQGQVSIEAVKMLREKLPNAEALLVGPGLGHSEVTANFLRTLLLDREVLPPLILDADALNILAEQTEWWRLLPPDSILTPHPGEMARLTGKTTSEVQADRLDLAVKMAGLWEQIVLLKGAYTVIAAPHGRTMVMPFANPALAKAGSGDVLAGAITGLRAQGLAPFEAAVAGAYLHGLAGELARDSLGAMSVVAGDLIDFLPAATILV
jgi:ADP-dependent NAD(P)H-hydrate dehydratase / NAD(P)H-hydrate epimerase